MRLKGILCLVSAAVMMSTCVMSASAADKSSSIAPFKADNSKLTTDTSAPTLSFDTNDWTKFLTKTKDSSKINFTMGQDKTYAYQGATLKISASLDKDITDFCTYSSLVKNTDGSLTYPGSDKDDAKYVTMGAEIKASDFGLNCFDGCMITFKYRINQEAEGKLMGDSVFVFPTNDKYERLSSTGVRYKINTTDSNNVTQYAKGVVPVDASCGATKLVIETPIIKTMKETDVLYIDNIQIVTPNQQNGKDLYVANVDGYNKSAVPQEIVEGITVDSTKKSDTSTTSSTADSTSKKSNLIPIICGGAGAVIVVGLVLFFVKRSKNKFY